MIPADQSSEKALIQQAQQRDAAAVAELYQRHAQQIYRYCLFRVADVAAAEDLTEEVFLNMVEALPRYANQGKPFAAWLYRIAHDRVVDYYRRRVRRPTAELTENLEDAQPGPEAQAIHNAELNRLRSAMSRLSEDDQLVLQLRFVEGCDVEQTARHMGKSIGAAKVLQHRALRRLAQLLGT